MPWNQSSPHNGNRRQPSRFKHIALLAAFIVAAVGLVAIIIYNNAAQSDDAEALNGKRPALIKEATPSLPTQITDSTGDEVSSSIKDDERQREIARIRAMTPDEKLEYLYERAKERPYDPNPNKGRAFSSGTEQVMSWIFTTRLGDPPPPLPQLSIFDEVHMAEIILNDNPVSEDDTEEIKDAKETVAFAKKELVKYITEGGDGFLTYYRDQLTEAYQEYNSARKKVYEAYRTGFDREVCDLYLQRINAELAEKGIKEVIVPEKLIERFAQDNQ